MQEMDLDELDQEVNKLMDQVGKSKAKKTPVDDAPADATPKTDDKPTDDAKPADENSGPVVVRRAAAQIVPRKSGIAMDIVQPKPTTATPPSAKAARVAPTLQPSKVVTPEPSKEKEKDKEKESEKKPADTPKAEVSDDTLASLDMKVDGKPKADLLSDPDHEAHKSVWPDPLDVHGFKDDAKDKDKKEENVNPEMAEPPKEEGKTLEHKAPEVKPATEDDKDEDKKDEEPADKKPAEDGPASTPFVAAKVEKRPLGAYADTKPEEEAPTEDKPADDDSKADDDQPKTDPASIAVQTPKELSPEVVAVESSEPEFIPGAPKLEGDETDMNNLRQMAIPQQYEGKDKKPSDKDRPIFDTKDYHPALSPTPTIHKSSKAGTVITIILILLMVGAAAVAYFTITGNLDLTKLL